MIDIPRSIDFRRRFSKGRGEEGGFHDVALFLLVSRERENCPSRKNIGITSGRLDFYAFYAAFRVRFSPRHSNTG